MLNDAMEKKVVRKRSGAFRFRRGRNISIVAVIAVVAADFKLPFKPVCVRTQRLSSFLFLLRICRVGF